MNKFALIALISTFFAASLECAASSVDEATIALFCAVRDKNESALQHALASTPNLHAKIITRGGLKDTPLTFASSILWPQGVRALINAGADVNETGHNFSPFKSVVQTLTTKDEPSLADAEAIMGILLRNGADIDAGAKFSGPNDLIPTLKELSKILPSKKERCRYKAAHDLIVRLMNQPENQLAD